MICIIQAYRTSSAQLAEMIYMFLLWRTRRNASLGRLRTTIQSMIAVATDRPYLDNPLAVMKSNKNRERTM